MGAGVGSGEIHVGSGGLHVGSARLFRYQHVGISNPEYKFGLGVKPNASPQREFCVAVEYRL